MYKMNLFLKIIIVILSIVGVIVTNNYYVLFAALIISGILLLINKKYLTFTLNAFLLIFLIFSLSINHLIIKTFLILIIFYLFYIYLSIRQRQYFKGKYYNYSNNNRRESFYERNFNNALTNIKNNKEMNYDKEVDIDDKLERDLERNYLQSRIRFYGFKNVNNYHYESSWKRLDYMILLLAIVLFIILLLI